ncbi:MAG: type I-C CRISPR-associated protein Cas7/Csd2 [Myxococcales bacterium]|nr:type I-C CRISPR-associated protein Cas7/Csd2 [Myxococcales bacterium]
MSSPVISKRYDFVLFFDVQDGNPNGDPDAGNLPRIDPETGRGLVTDVCLKRKVRNYVLLKQSGEAPYDIFIKEKAVLNAAIEQGYKSIGLDRNDKNKGKGEEVDRARVAMCNRYFDVRTFGAVMSTGANAGQVRGPVQLTFARSIDSILSMEHSITRCAVATEGEADKQDGDNRTMGRKATLPYGLYRAHGFVSAALAERSVGRRAQGTGFSEDDLTLFWEALERMFDHDHSAARGLMSTRALVIFEHEDKLGDAPAAALFDRVKAKAKVDVPRSWSDYVVTLDGKVLETLRTIIPVKAAGE